MNILFVAVDKGGHFAPFVEEQMESLRACHTEAEPIVVERFLVNGKGIKGYLRTLPALRVKIRDFQPDIIHAHYGLCGLLACFAAILPVRRTKLTSHRLSPSPEKHSASSISHMQSEKHSAFCILHPALYKLPVVTTYHGSDINSPKVFRFTKRAMRLSAHNIFVSQRTMDIAFPSPTFTDIHRPLAFTRSSLLPCGINLPSERNEYMTQWVDGVLEPDKKHVLFAGAFDNDVKDPALAKQVVDELRTITDVPVQLIELKGYTRDQVNALMYTCDAFLMTSKTEGSPQVIKEAMACGCPIVSTDVGDVRERLTLSPSFTDIHPHSPSNTGLLSGCYVASGRDPEELAALLQQALSYGQRTEGRQLIIDAGLTNDVVAEKLMEIYQKVLTR